MALSFAIPMFLHGEDPDALPLIIFFAFPFTVIVIYALIGQLIFRPWTKSRTYYVVTDERVMAITKRFGRSVHASFLDEITAIKSAGSLHGSSTLWFGEPAWWVVLLGAGLLDSPAPSLGDDGPVAFYDIREAARVRDLVMNRDLRT